VIDLFSGEEEATGSWSFETLTGGNGKGGKTSSPI
jgi:hypothetical protein